MQREQENMANDVRKEPTPKPSSDISNATDQLKLSKRWEKYLNTNVSGMEDVNPSDPNYKHHKLLLRIQNAYSALPCGWSKNPNVGEKSNEAPYIHESPKIIVVKMISTNFSTHVRKMLLFTNIRK